MDTKFDIIQAAREVFAIEGKALEKTSEALDERFEQIVQLIF